MRAYILLLALTIVLVATALVDAQGRHGRPGSPGPVRPNCPGSGNRPPVCPPVYCPGPGTNPCHPYPWPCVPSQPHGCWHRPPCDGYLGSGCGTWQPSFATYPLFYVDGPYDTSTFSYWLAGWGARLPYYESDPVQYAYTPIDIPPRTLVARPARASTFSRILPRQFRKPLY